MVKIGTLYKLFLHEVLFSKLRLINLFLTKIQNKLGLSWATLEKEQQIFKIGVGLGLGGLGLNHLDKLQ